MLYVAHKQQQLNFFKKKNTNGFFFNLFLPTFWLQREATCNASVDLVWPESIN